ncbi:OmpA family protein [Hydrogenothermus marinus]|uniref:Outer membrane protein OmpA-like peptidoglycan-associated protein n=1 Tax=Hydrogenothermus marinus TaxID=133270 RepID=A0A3M0C2Y6_9AQUI|nr:OmpA family protein [Hydrogenothermus marinus]RMA97312.1 outer membrane protein OmpA-like peptidoglycan-associated protein [Hydrogenothermus marinus]
MRFNKSKNILILLSIFSIATASQASISLQYLKQSLNELRNMHAKECAPKDFAIAESYIETLEGFKVRKNGKFRLVKLSPTDKFIYKNEAFMYLERVKKGVLSDVDNDGIPCYKEIAQGTNPYVSDKKVKIVKKEKPIKKKEVKKKEFEPLKLNARIHFEFDSANIKKEYLPYLNVISRYLKTHKNLKVKIIGYTDNIGSKKYNDKLALERAKAVKNYLIKMGIDPKRIEIVGKGKEDYLFDNKTNLNRFTNRRAEFFVMETK